MTSASSFDTLRYALANPEGVNAAGAVALVAAVAELATAAYLHEAKPTTN